MAAPIGLIQAIFNCCLLIAKGRTANMRCKAASPVSTVISWIRHWIIQAVAAEILCPLNLRFIEVLLRRLMLCLILENIVNNEYQWLL